MDDYELMGRALELALRSPVPDANPRVGCVLARDGVIVGEGWHRGSGTPHAEVAALAGAGEAARGATAYVSLEPCSHTGRTGPCVHALLEAGVVRVVYGASDPTPDARGGGAALAASGVVVDRARVSEASALNTIWAKAMQLGRPVVTWKVAGTLDGRTAASDGTSQWITGEAARADVHALRARVGAIIVGTGTALADDPHLTVRSASGVVLGRRPLRVVVGSRPLPPGARVLDDAAETLLHPGPPRAVLAELFRRGIRHVLLEGGAGLAASFLTAGLVDEVVAYLAPTLLGSGAPLVGDVGVVTLADAHRFSLVDVARIGDDVRITLNHKEK